MRFQQRQTLEQLQHWHHDIYTTNEKDLQMDRFQVAAIVGIGMMFGTAPASAGVIGMAVPQLGEPRDRSSRSGIIAVTCFPKRSSAG